jgi:hypothetical protein
MIVKYIQVIKIIIILKYIYTCCSYAATYIFEYKEGKATLDNHNGKQHI